MAIRFIYFDLGNVLLSFCHDRMCRQMAEVAGVSPETVRRALLDGAPGASLQWQLERGDVGPEEAYRRFCEMTGSSPDRAALYAAGSDIFAPLAETVALAERLHAAGTPLGILSNTNPFDWGYVTGGAFPFVERLFRVAALSFEARAMKPERAIYDHAARLAGQPAGAIFFTDDRPENVAGALAAGFDGVVFESAAQLADELRRRGFAAA